jgi:hypothetical protein
MTTLKRYAGRHDVLGTYGELITICKTRREAQSFIVGFQWRLATPDSYENEADSKHQS